MLRNLSLSTITIFILIYDLEIDTKQSEGESNSHFTCIYFCCSAVILEIENAVTKVSHKMPEMGNDKNKKYFVLTIINYAILYCSEAAFTYFIAYANLYMNNLFNIHFNILLTYHYHWYYLEFNWICFNTPVHLVLLGLSTFDTVFFIDT